MSQYNCDTNDVSAEEFFASVTFVNFKREKRKEVKLTRGGGNTVL